MQTKNSSPPSSPPLQLSRRAALGSIVAVAVPAVLADLVAAQAPAAAQNAGAPLRPARKILTREGATSTVLADGRLMLAGGYRFSALSSVQILDPARGVWFDAAPLRTPRHQHAAALLPDGRVLVCGGIHVDVLSDCEVYDPFTNTWTQAAAMPVPRSGHNVTVSGQGAIVTGGAYLQPLQAAALFDGANWRLL